MYAQILLSGVPSSAKLFFFVRVYSLLGSESINQSVFNRVPNVPFQSYYVPKVVKKREFSGGEFQFQISIKGKGHHSTLKETNQA